MVTVLQMEKLRLRNKRLNKAIKRHPGTAGDVLPFPTNRKTSPLRYARCTSEVLMFYVRE